MQAKRTPAKNLFLLTMMMTMAIRENLPKKLPAASRPPPPPPVPPKPARPSIYILLGLCSFEGSWPLTDDTVKALDFFWSSTNTTKSVAEKQALISALVSDTTVAMTMVVLWILKVKYYDESTAWKVLSEKVYTWLLNVSSVKMNRADVLSYDTKIAALFA
eukprot:PhF_6_TR13031/c0_g1_i3/m.20681